MNGCEEVLPILVAVARAETVSAAGRKFLQEHVDGCPACRLRVANEQVLTAGLRAVALASMDAPSPELKSALASRFRSRNERIPVRSAIFRRYRWAVWPAAAVLAFCALLPLKSRVQRSRSAPIGGAIATATIKTVEPATSRPMAQVPARQKVVRSSRPRLPRPQPEPEVATAFIEIPYSPPLRPEERADVVRIEVPRASMAAFGLPVAGGRLDSLVAADVLMGEDGVARAVRFIR